MASGGLLKLLDAYIAIGGDASDFDRVVDKSEAKAKAAGGRLESAFSPRKVLGALGAAAGAAAGAAIAPAGAAVGAFVAGAVQEFAKFQKGMNEVFTLMPGMSKAAMGKMSADVEAFSRETGKLPEEVIPALYQAISAGVPPENVFAFLETANKAAVGGVTDLTSAVDGISSVVNAYGADILSAADASDILFTGVRLGKTTFEELSKTLFQVVPTAAALGVGLDQVTAALATMTGQGIPTSVATTQLRQLFVELSKEGSATAAVFEKIAGKSFKQFIAEGGNVQDALKLMEKRAQDTGVGVNDLFSSVEAGGAALALTGKATEKLGGNLDEMGKRAGTTERSFETMDTGIEATTRKIAAHIRTFAIDVGRQFEALGPIFVLFGPTMGRAIGAGFGGLAGILTKTLIPKVTAAVLATGPGAALAASGVGTMIGVAMSAAVPFAIAAGLGLAIAGAFKAIFLDPGLQEQSRAIGTAVADQIVTGTTDQLEQSKAAIAQGIADINALPLGGFLYGDQIRDLEAQAEVVGAEIAKRTAAGVDSGAPAVAAAFNNLPMAPTPAQRVEMMKASIASGIDSATALAQGILAARSKPADAFATMITMMKNALTPAAEAARLKGQLASAELAKGLKSGDPAVRAQARAVAQAAADRLGQLAAGGGKAGKAAMAALDAGIRSKVPEIRAASIAIKNVVVVELDKTKAPAGVAGANAGAAYAAALLTRVTSALGVAKGASVNGPRIYEPGMKSGATGMPFVAYDQPVYVHQREAILTVPQAEQWRAAVGGGGGGGLGRNGGATINVYVTNPAPEPASTSTRRELRKMALSGSAA